MSRWNIRRFWYRVMRRLCRKVIQEALTDALHPEFGWVWRDEELGGQFIKAAELRGWQDAIEAQREQKDQLLQRIGMAIGLMNHSPHQQTVLRWWNAVRPELEKER
jgi:hypothetical protein